MNPNTQDFIREKIQAVNELTSLLESWENNLKEHFGLLDLSKKYVEDNTFEFDDKLITRYEEIDEIEFEESCTRNMLVQQFKNEMRNLQKNFRIELSNLVSHIVSVPKRTIQRTKNTCELNEKHKYFSDFLSETCPITQAPIIEPLKSICCGKFFNKIAFDKWIQKEFSCPTCRKPIKQEKGAYVLLVEKVPKKVEEVMFTPPCCRRSVPISAYNLALETSNGYCPICNHDILSDLFYNSLQNAFAGINPQAASTRSSQ
jgi:hypothetical protein